MSFVYKSLALSSCVSILVVCLLAGAAIVDTLRGNKARLVLLGSLGSLRDQVDHVGSELNDGIPDGWVPGMWGPDTRGVGSLEDHSAAEGRRAYRMLMTNGADGALVLSQRLHVQPAGAHLCQLWHLGGGGAVYVRDTDGNTIAGLTTESGAEWQLASLEFDATFNDSAVDLLLLSGPSGNATSWDGVNCWSKADSTMATVVKNGGFEQDGYSIADPWAWWLAAYCRACTFGEIQKQSYDYLRASGHGMSDPSLLSWYEHIAGKDATTPPVGDPLADCEDGSRSPLWLWLGVASGTGVDIATQERIARTAIAISPQCPAGYAILATEFTSSDERRGWSRAADLYHQAALHSNRSSSSGGAYWFHEGYLRSQFTGEWAAAFSALEKATALDGWESTQWQRSVAQELYSFVKSKIE